MSMARFASFASIVVLPLALFALPQLQESEGAPPQPEQDRMITAMTQYADDYTSKLPNFICQQSTTQYSAGKKSDKWHKGDMLTSKLVFNGGREERTLELVNNKQVKDRRQRFKTSFSSEGEFGILLSKIFDPASAAKFSWVQWGTIREHKTARIDYAIDLQHSSMELTNYIKAKVPYHGSVYIDPANGTVWRVTSGTTQIPTELQMTSIATTIDYDSVDIGAQKYLLPVSATVVLVTDRDQVKNDIRFDRYRKFEAESTITFGPNGGDHAKPANPPR